MQKSENFSNNRFSTGGRGAEVGTEYKKKSPSTADITNDWHYTSTHPICLNGMARDLTLLFYLYSNRNCRY
jgi:hypothetical protein